MLKFWTRRLLRLKKLLPNPDLVLSPGTTATVLLAVHTLGLCLWWIAGSYFGVDEFSSKSFYGDDGWCDAQTQGLGVHCWGDYYYPVFQLTQTQIWGGDYPNPGPAAALVPFVIFGGVGNFLGQASLGLFLYLTFLAGSIVASVWLATKNFRSDQRTLLLLTVALLSPGVAVVLDRGNSVGFLVPLLILFLSAIKSGNVRLMVASIVLMSLIKVHFAALLFVLIFSGRFRGAFSVLAISLIVHISSFALINPQEFPRNVLNWLEQISRYQEYSSVSIPWPPNISFAQSIYSVLFGFERISDLDLGHLMTFVEMRQGVFGPLVLGVLLVTIAIFRKSLTEVQITILVFSAVSLTSATTYFYYTVLAIPAILFLIRAPEEIKERAQIKSNQTVLRNKIDLILWVSCILTFVQFPILTFTQGPLVLTTASLIGAVWIMGYFAIVVTLVSGKLRRTSTVIHQTVLPD